MYLTDFAAKYTFLQIEDTTYCLWTTFLTRDFYTRLAPIEGAPQALAGRAMSVSGTPESGLAREVASEKNNKL